MNHIIFIFANICICSISVQGQTTPVTAPTVAPLVPVSPDCALLNPKCKEDVIFLVGESNWFVGKIYINPNPTPCTPAPAVPPPVAPPTVTPPPVTTPPATPIPVVNTDNQCSIFNHGPDCTGIKIQVSRSELGAVCMKVAGLNTKTNTVATYKLVLLPGDVTKTIYKVTFGFYGFITADGKHEVAQTTTQEIKDKQNTEIVMIDEGGENNEWGIFTTCNKSVIFVLYSEQVVKDQKTKDFDAKILEVLKTLTQEEVKDVPFDWPIATDFFIQPLTPPPPP